MGEASGEATCTVPFLSRQPVRTVASSNRPFSSAVLRFGEEFL